MCIPLKNTIKERLNSFKGWLNDFLFGDEDKIGEMRADIFRKNENSENIDKKLDRELGILGESYDSNDNSLTAVKSKRMSR